MSWVKTALQAITQGQEVKVRPIGGSMKGRIESGQLVTLVPSNYNDINVDDVVFIKWKNNYLLHLVKQKKDGKVLIGNNLGRINGWVDKTAILAKVVSVAD